MTTTPYILGLWHLEHRLWMLYVTIRYTRCEYIIYSGRVYKFIIRITFYTLIVYLLNFLVYLYCSIKN